MMAWWRHIVGRARADRDLALEIEAHIAEHEDDLVDRGMPRAEARRLALREFGNRARCLEESRSVWLITWLVSLGQDLRYLLRTLRRQIVYSASVVLTLTCGIGLVTALFTVFNARVLRPWPVPDPASLVVVRPLPGAGEQYGTLSNAEYRYLREHARSFSHLASSISGGGPVGRSDGTMFATVQTKYVTANYFDALRVGMTLGRGFLPEEEDYGAPSRVVVISERIWREYLGSDPSILGAPIRVGDRMATVVGVAERGFADIRGALRVDLWLPLPAVAIAADGTLSPDWMRSFSDPRQASGLVFGRLQPGVAAERARAELDLLSAQFRRGQGMDAPGLRLSDTRPLSSNSENVRAQVPAQSLMLAALFLVMLLACANAGNLVLANTMARRDEIAIRLSLGASRSRVARQLITETLVLSLIAAAAALYLAAIVPPALIRLGGSEIVNRDNLSPDARVFAFALVMSIVACAFASLGPASRVTRAVEIGSGKDKAINGPARNGLRVSLLAMQIALSTVLLVSAGLLTRAISHAMTVDPGFAIAGVQEVSLVLPRNAPADGLRRIRETLTTAGLPEMGFSSLQPITSSRMEIGVRHPTQDASKSRRLVLRPVTPNYFSILGIRVVDGRMFVDRPDAREMVVSQRAARELWRDGDPIGKHLLTRARNGDTESHEVVGVAADVSTTTIAEIEGVIYQPVREGRIALLRDESPVTAARIRELVQAAVPGASASSRPLMEDMRDSLMNLVIGSRIAWGLGLLALVLAMLGAFGVFAAMVEERRREIGVRMALGARGTQVIRLVLGGAIRPVVAGLAAGLVLSAIGTPVLRRALYGMSPFDPIAYLEIAALLVASSLVATWIPAARAARVEPAITLRGD